MGRTVRLRKSLETGYAQLTDKLLAQIQGQEERPARRRSRSFVQQISPSNLLLLKAALLDEDAAIAAYRAWRPTLDLETISYGQQRLLPLLQSNLTRFGIEDPLADRFRGIRRYFWVQNLKAMAFAQRVFAALDQAGVSFIVLKGAALIACYLTDRSLRPMGDIDILVPEERLADAIAVLTAMNLHPGILVRDVLLNCRDPRIPGCNFVGPHGNIDLHWKALHLDLRPGADDRFWDAHRKASLDGMPIRVLDPAHQLIHICAHAAQRDPGMETELWPADAIQVIRGSKDLSVERLIREADQRRLSVIMAESLRFLADEFGVALTSAISRLDASASWTERLEMRLRPTRSKKSRTRNLLSELVHIRRSGISLTDLLTKRTGTAQITPALVVASQIALGRPDWLRRILGRDRYRILPRPDRLPKVGDTLNLCDPVDETPIIAGWWRPEPWGLRTSGHEATVAYCVQGYDQDLTLLIDGFMDADGVINTQGKSPLQRIDLWANDWRLASWRFEPNTKCPLTTRVLVPRSLIRSSDVLVLSFVIHCEAIEMCALCLRSLALVI